MKKLLGIFLFLAILYALLLFADPGARSIQNHLNLGQRIGLYGILSLAVGMLIITGGIDLSMGSVVALTSTVFAMLVRDKGWSPIAAMPVVIGLGVIIGSIHGLLVTQVRVQAFIVTLCGLFVYRGIARWIANDAVKGLGSLGENWKEVLNTDLATVLERWTGTELPIPKIFHMHLVLFLVILALATLFLHFTRHGRYFFALGSNERAAKYSGIPVDTYRIAAYVLCSTLTALFSIPYLLYNNSATPSSTGNFFELYAIAGAVLGGCSLRGGEGTSIGILVGTAIIWLLPNLTNMWGIPSSLEYTVIGIALLLGATLDEVLRRWGRVSKA
jgi:ribose transport system permease protein